MDDIWVQISYPIRGTECIKQLKMMAFNPIAYFDRLQVLNLMSFNAFFSQFIRNMCHTFCLSCDFVNCILWDSEKCNKLNIILSEQKAGDET